MKRNWKWLAAAVAAGLLVMAIAIPVLADSPDGANSNTPTPTVQRGYGNGYCQGLGIGVGPDEAVTEVLGMTRDQIQEQRLAGKSLVQIATSKNITETALINAIIASKQAKVQQMVSAGTLTQAQADQRLEQMRERVQLAVNRTTSGPPEWAGSNGTGGNGMGQGMGMMRQSGSGGNQANCTGTPGTGTGAGRMMRSGRGLN